MSLAARGIRVGYGRRIVLDGVGFEARPGEVGVIVGPNGSGKTTLLRALTGDVEFAGTVTLNGRALCEYRGWELAACRAVLPQALGVAFAFSVDEVVRMGLMASREAADASLPGRALEAVGLGGHAARAYHELSGGEQQRVQMARVLAQVWHPVRDGVPRWLILDEPVSSLDIRHQLDLIALIRRYARGGGGVVAVMHDLNLTAMCADRVTVMAGGRVLAAGPVGATLTDAVLSRAYGCPLRVNRPPPAGAPFVLPQSAGAEA